MIKLYLKAIAAAFIGIGAYGYVAPAYISSTDNVEVLIGVLVCLSAPVVMFSIFKKEITKYVS